MSCDLSWMSWLRLKRRGSDSLYPFVSCRYFANKENFRHLWQVSPIQGNAIKHVRTNKGILCHTLTYFSAKNLILICRENKFSQVSKVGAGCVYAKCLEIWSLSVVTMEGCARWRAGNKRMVCLETQMRAFRALSSQPWRVSVMSHVSVFMKSQLKYSGDFQLFTFHGLQNILIRLSEGRCPWLVMWWVGLSDPIECDPMSLSANGSDLCPWIMTRVLSILCRGSKYLIR